MKGNFISGNDMLGEAVRIYAARRGPCRGDELGAMLTGMMFKVRGVAGIDPFDRELCAATMALTVAAHDAVSKLGPRAREARLNALWRGFVEKHRAAA